MSKKKKPSKASQSTSTQPGISSNSVKQSQYTSATAGSSSSASVPSTQAKPPVQGVRKAAIIPKPAKPQAPLVVPEEPTRMKTVRFTAEPHDVEAHGLPDALQIVTCAENIALLQMLTATPRQSLEYAASTACGASELASQRTFSIKEEKQLATTLAFLSSSSNNSNHITAVCIEETPTMQACKVLLAINKLSVDCGQSCLDKLQEGFEGIFGELHRLSSNPSKATFKTIQDNVFNRIVAMCRLRIMARLGLRTPIEDCGDRTKPFIALSLDTFLTATKESKARQKAREGGIPVQTFDSYIKQTRDLLSYLYLFQSLETPSHKDLVDLIRHIAGFMEHVPLKTLLKYLDDIFMQASSRQRLHGCFTKTARVLESARFLCQQTLKFPVLRSTVVEQVCLPDGAFQRPTNIKAVGSLEFVLARLSRPKNPLILRSLPIWARKAISSPVSFQSIVKKILRESKIHAEVQILAYYANSAPDVIRPRIIASSKKPCFLCDTLIRLHGAYTVPEGHGKLYSGWCIPTIPEFSPLREKLNRHLEDEIIMHIRRLSYAQKMPTNNFLNESSIYSLDLSVPTPTTLSNISNTRLASGILDSHKVNLPSIQATDCPTSVEAEHFESISSDVHKSPYTSTTNCVGTGAKGLDSIPNVTIEGLAQPAVDGGLDIDRLTESNETAVPDPTGTHEKSPTSTGAGSHTKAAQRVKQPENVQSPSLQQSQQQIALPPFKKMGSRNWFRSAGLDIFMDESSLPFTPRWLSTEDAVSFLQRHEADLVNVQSLKAQKDTLVTCKTRDGDTCFVFKGRVVVLELHTHAKI